MTFVVMAFSCLARSLVFLGLALVASAQTVLLTPNTTVLSSTGGVVTFTASLKYTTLPSTLGFSVTLPTGWTYVSGTSVPGTSPAEPAIAPTAGRTALLEWAFVTPPPSPVTFTFTASYPGTATGLQSLVPTTIARDAIGSPPVTTTAPTYSLSAPSNLVSWNGGNGNWTDSSLWTPNTVPNNSGGTRYSATVSAGVAALNTSVIIDNLTFTGGTIGGSGNLTLQGLGSTWTGGVFNGLGEIVISSGAQLTASGASAHVFSQQTIRNQGNFTWADTGPLQSGNGGGFINSAGATFVDATTGPGDAVMSNPTAGTFTFTNAGFVNKTNPTTTRIEIPFSNSGNIHVSAGTLRFVQSFTQTGGTLNVATGATARFDLGLNFPSGVIHGGGTVIANVTNGGFISPGDAIGTLTISGNLTLLGSSQLQFDIAGPAAGSGHDVLAVTGTAVLNGTFSFQLSPTAASFLQSSDSLTLLTSTGRTGTFTNVANGTRVFATSGTASFLFNYTPTGFTLSGFQAIPEPSTWALLLTGLGALVAATRRRR
jgi:hypothetical protein